MRLLITGGTGFVGQHLLDVIASGVTSLSMNDVVIASRSPQLAGHDVETVKWDVTSGSVPNLNVDAVIHAATPASADLNARSPRLMFDQILEGARNVIEFCAKQKNPPRIVFTSSGAVYGEMPPDVTAWPEDSQLAADPLNPNSAYASGKRAAESLIALAGHEGVCRPTIARLFAFSGRHLPLNRHFAIGNFIRDALKGGPIRIRGNGASVRSYLDGDDLGFWLLQALLKDEGFGRILHVGSDEPISITELAILVSERAWLKTRVDVRVKTEDQRSDIDGLTRYVPSVSHTREILGIVKVKSLSESIDEMMVRHSC